MQQLQVLGDLLAKEPSLTTDNVEAASTNVRNLEFAYEQLAQSLYGESAIIGSTNGVQVMASIQDYISDFTLRVEEHLNSEGEPSPVTIAEDFAFGFEAYVEQASVPEIPEVIPLIDQQRQILTYVITELLASDPLEIMSVKRMVFAGESLLANSDNSGFKMPKDASASMKGLIQTIPFKLQFRAYTAVWKFLNKLAMFEMPILVRSIQVNRKDNEDPITPIPNTTSLEELFGTSQNVVASENLENRKLEQKPIISENASNFTLF